MSSENEKSKGVAYLLLVLGPMFGFCGLHRLYMGQIGTGILWLLTFGILGIGQLVDLFTYARVIDNHNLNLKLRQQYHSSPGIQPGGPPPIPGAAPSLSQQLMDLKRLKPDRQERVLLRFIQSKGGMVTSLEIFSASCLNMEEAKERLDNFCVLGVAELRLTEGGEMIYVFPGFLDDEQKKTARSVLSI